MTDTAPVYRFTGRATGEVPEGHFYITLGEVPAHKLSVLAETRNDATRKALDVLGPHPIFGDHPGWKITWDQIDEETPA